MPPAAAAKSLQSCLTLCDPIDSSPKGSALPGILQARTLEWVVISFSNEWKWKVKVKSLSRGRLFATPWTAAYQALLSMGLSRQEYWSGLSFPSPGDLHDSEIKPGSPALQADSYPLHHQRSPPAYVHDASGSSCIFIAPLLELPLSPRSPASFCWGH